MLGLTQAELAKRAGMSTTGLNNIESGGTDPKASTLRAIEEALVAAGAIFIAPDGEGAGVRLKLAMPRLEGCRVSLFDRLIQLRISYRGMTHSVQFSADILDDMDRANYESEEDLRKAFDAHQNKILQRAAAAIDAGRTAGNGPLILEETDFSGLL